jgi:hypothetical protein
VGKRTPERSQESVDSSGQGEKEGPGGVTIR